MRYSFGFLCVCALGVVPLVGCSETAGSGGTGGTGGAILCEGDFDCDDENECTKELCDLADGMCAHSNEPRSTACDGDGVCDGAGTCVECNDDEQCNDFNDCTSDTCDSENGACNDPTPVADGTQCAGGTCEAGACALSGTVLPCTEQGIRNAIAAGGDDTYTFDCNGPEMVATEAEIVIDNDVILDGEGNLGVDGNDDHRLFSVTVGVTAELHGFTVIRGATSGTRDFPELGGGISNDGTLTLTNSTVSGNKGKSGGIGGGIVNTASLTVISSTVANNSGWGDALYIGGCFPNRECMTTIANTLIQGDCLSSERSEALTSAGYNIESPGNNCGFDPDGTDQVGVDADDLQLGELANNGSPTMTHALEAGSVAIDQIPGAGCEVNTDQRGKPRPAGPDPKRCDVGSFERQSDDSM